MLHIRVENPEHVMHGVKEIRINGKKMDRETRPLLPESILNGLSEASVLVTMGV